MYFLRKLMITRNVVITEYVRQLKVIQLESLDEALRHGRQPIVILSFLRYVILPNLLAVL